MDLKRIVRQGMDLGGAALARATGAVSGGLRAIGKTVGGLRLFGSLESSGSYDDAKVDEKHYFLVPYVPAEHGYTLYSMRCLPEGVPPINDLPKRRILHLTDPAGAALVEELVRKEAREEAEGRPAGEKGLGDRIIALADGIDRLDHKVFGGLLVIGGLVALVNPIAGAAVAAKALVPSMGLLLSRFGLKYLGEKAGEKALRDRVRAAEEEVLRQFRGSEARSIVNPVLRQLDRALRTSEAEYDPLMETDFSAADFGGRDRQRLLKLTCRAISGVYEEVLGKPASCRAAKLGPEDVRWLELVRDLAGKEG